MSVGRPGPCRTLNPSPLFIAVAAAVATLAAPAIAEQQMRDTVVTATRSEAAIDDLPVTVTTVTRKDLDRRLPTDDADLFRDEPDVAMARDLRRHGATRVNIRGIEDNRVVQMVDGVRLPDYYNGGGPTNFNMNASASAMPDFLRQIEIVRGPSSSLYGSDAIGGVVGYVTLDPNDIASGDKKMALRVRGGYYGAADSISGSVIGAIRGEAMDFLIGYAESRGEETRNKGEGGTFGADRSKPNPLNIEDRGMLAKAIIRPTAGHKLTASLEGREQEVQSDIKRIPTSLRRISQMLGDDNNQRIRGSLEYEHRPEGAFYDRMLAKVYHQDSDTHNKNYQRRSNTTGTCSASTAGANNCDISQDFFFKQKSTGAGLQFETLLGGGAVTHLLTYGADLMRQKIEELRDGTVTNLTTGVTTKSLAGETYPLRDYAIGTTDTLGLFAQDEIGLVGGRLTLTPGIRYDYTRLKPEIDQLAQQVLSAIGRQAVEQSHSAVSPKFGAQWKFTETLSTFGQIAAGFRAPNYSEVNGAFRNATQVYATSPNPDLKPETSVGIELGLRARNSTMRGQISAYDNHYKDFIENVRLNCPSDPSCISIGGTPYTTYMSKNLSDVRIYGAEARGSWDFMPGWRVDGGLAWARGSNEETNLPLNSIEPMRMTLGVTRDAGSWGSEGRLRAATRKDRIDDTGGTYFRTPGYVVADFAAWVKPSRDTQVTVGINNLFDQKYWQWSDIRQADATNPAGVEFYTQPGRTFRVAFQADF